MVRFTLKLFSSTYFGEVMVCSLVVLLVMQAGAAVFESELPPGNDRILYMWETATPQLRAEPYQSAQVVKTLDAVRNHIVEYDSTRFRTISAGGLVAMRGVRLFGRDFGSRRFVSTLEYREKRPVRSWDIAVGDTLRYLLYRAEGTCFVQLVQTVIEAQPCPIEQPEDWKTLRDARTELWIRVTTVGRPLGWVRAGASITKLYTPPSR